MPLTKKEQEELVEEVAEVIERDSDNIEKAKAKAIDHLADTKKPELLTEIDDEEIKLITALESLAIQVNFKPYSEIAKIFKLHRVSMERKGRKELIKVSESPQESSMGGSWREKIPFLRSNKD